MDAITDDITDDIMVKGELVRETVAQHTCPHADPKLTGICQRTGERCYFLTLMRGHPHASFSYTLDRCPHAPKKSNEDITH